MSGFRSGQEQGQQGQQGHDAHSNPYYAANPDYATHPESEHQRVFVPNVQLHEQHIAAHAQQQQQPVHHAQHQVYEHGMAQSPHFGQQMMYGAPQPQPQRITGKRPRPDDLELEGYPPEGMGGPQLGEMQGMSSQMPGPSMVNVGYGPQPVPHQTYHSHQLPQHRAKQPRMSEGDSMVGPSGGAPSVVGLEGMPAPAPRPRGPKLKFTPEDDALLVDLKENKSLTWKQIAEFFPGRSSGTLQVRYCTKLKAKTTQWTEETIQKLRTALHDYEQEKWRIVAQKVGTGFTSAACKEKAREL
ncbi:hypothetical protein EG329_014160 [Mollisiaceae sp. DMI_Dod_QoI]|nr:hypothetical protein EG329_014160 [Helotiales sp. DMI_Dod_QoI]